ncbi:MAG: replicative DNA helicase [Deltaproteobacteria bacterium CG03_land_8_20_14_0_80_45_14]|nr:MAG: replicative DNA helicase [Deltaproteobacteria bacterium CG03_land_8_20_14_0_80_45_14]
MNEADLSSHKLPPQNIEAEQSILGGILIENEAVNRVMEILDADDFYRDAHRKIFNALINLSERDEPADLITLTNELRKIDQLDFIGGASYLASLIDSVPTAANIEYYAKIVKEKAILRKLIQTSTDIITQSYEDRGDVEGFLDEAERAIFEISEKRVKPSFYSIREIVKESFATIERLFKKKELVTGVPSGFKELDRMTAGFQPSDLIIIAGRPSMGKTAFCLNVAQYAAIENKIPVAIFSLEMSKEQLVIRMLCSEAHVEGTRLRTGFLNESDWPKLTIAAGNLSEAPIYIDDTAALSVLELRAKARRLKSDHGLGMVILDYLQLMKGRARVESRQQEISEISRSLKALSKELNIPVIAVSQLSRKTEERTGNRPQLSDLRESGAIEQDADLILFLYRDEIYNRSEDNPNRGKAEVIIGKQRNGPIGKIDLAFLDKFTTFKDLYKGETENTYESS